MSSDIYIRVREKDGSWQNVEIERLTDEGLDQIEKNYPERGWWYAKALARHLRDNVKVMKCVMPISEG